MTSIPRPEKISLANLPTPLRPLDRLSEQLGGPRIWLKQDELTELALSGNKVRKLEYVLADAVQSGADTLLTCGGVQSNHCRATALAAARLGLDCHLILRGPMETDNDGNLLLDNLAGAEITVYDGSQFVPHFDQIRDHWLAHYKSQGQVPYFIPMGASNGVGLWGYITGSEELYEQTQTEGFTPEVIVCATGSGGTQAGLTLGWHLLNRHTRVQAYAVCDSASYFQQKVLTDVAHWQQRYSPLLGRSVAGNIATQLSVHTSEDYIGPGYARGYPALYESMTLAAELEGILLDPVYTGKAFHGMIEDIKLGNYQSVKNIVFVHTGGVYGLFPQRVHFNNRARVCTWPEE